MGVEPTNGGFADLSLRPLGYRAEARKYSETGVLLSVPGPIANNLNRCNGALARCRGDDLGFADKAGGFLGRRWTDVESGAPLKARHLR